MKVYYPVLITAILANLVLTQIQHFVWNEAERPALGCKTGTKCASFRRCFQLVIKAAHLYGTKTASALRLYFSDRRHGQFSPLTVYGRLVDQRCPGHERTCCPALYRVHLWTVDLLNETLNTTKVPPGMSENLIAEESRTSEESPKSSKTTTESSVQRKKQRLKNRAMLEEQCKTPLHDRVFLGQDVKAGQLPWAAMLQYEENGTLSFSCGGTLISDRYILTAAHCANSKKMKLVSARLGEVALNSDCDDVAEQNYLNAIEEVFGDLKSSTPSAEYGANPPNSCAATPLDVPVEEVVVHPGYKYSLIDGFPNDLALVRLAESVQLSPFVHPICLRGLAKNLTPKEEAQGVLTVAGWGMTNMEDGPRSENLKQATVQSVPRNICRVEHKVMVRDRCQKCAGGMKGNVCMGDSGGPLVLKVKHKMSYLIGVVSFGSFNCGALATPSVFSDLTCYIDWILDTIRPTPTE